MEEDDFTDRYGYNSGTSMASPMVAGAVAFAALNFPDDTVQERKNRILNAVIPLASLSDKVLNWRHAQPAKYCRQRLR